MSTPSKHQSAHKSIPMVHREIVPQILTLEELNDIPTRNMPKQNSVFRKNEDTYLGKRERPASLKSLPTPSRQASSSNPSIRFEDIMNGIMKRHIQWNDIIFNRDCLEVLKQRPSLLLP